jgi:hypothetical protein
MEDGIGSYDFGPKYDPVRRLTLAIHRRPASTTTTRPGSHCSPPSWGTTRLSTRPCRTAANFPTTACAIPTRRSTRPAARTPRNLGGPHATLQPPPPPARATRRAVPCRDARTHQPKRSRLATHAPPLAERAHHGRGRAGRRCLPSPHPPRAPPGPDLFPGPSKPEARAWPRGGGGEGA